MPIVEKICKFFNLIIYDPQEDQFLLPKSNKSIAKTLIDSWILHNTKAIRAIAKKKDIELFYLDEKSSTYWWKYATLKEKLENEIDEDIFIPEIMIMYDNSKNVFTLSVWPDNIPQFFPVTDYVLIMRSKSKFFIEKSEEFGLIKYSKLMAELNPFLEIYDKDLNLKVLQPAKIKKTLKIFNKLDLTKFNFNDYGKLSPTKIQNVIKNQSN